MELLIFGFLFYFFDDGQRLLTIPAGEDDRRLKLGKSSGCLFADPCGGAGDDDDLSFHIYCKLAPRTRFEE